MLAGPVGSLALTMSPVNSPGSVGPLLPLPYGDNRVTVKFQEQLLVQGCVRKRLSGWALVYMSPGSPPAGPVERCANTCCVGRWPRKSYDVPLFLGSAQSHLLGSVAVALGTVREMGCRWVRG